jgi:hypothetical protein
MKRFYLAVPAVAVAAVGIALVLRPAGNAEGNPGGAVHKAQRAPALKELVSTGTGVLKGKVVFKGPKPDLKAATAALQAQMNASADKATCFRGTADEIIQQKWRIDPKGGVANVFVALKAPKGTFFKVDTARKTWPDEVVIDQPHCAFLPHAVVLFPAYRRAAKDQDLTPTGQKFVVKNSAPMTHNVFYAGGTENNGLNKSVPPKGQQPVSLNPTRLPIEFRCTIHPWMNARLWPLDHPYAAVTGPDGTYEIKNAPAGVKLRVLAWHEEVGFLSPSRFEGDELELSPGVNTKDYEMRAPKPE